MRNLLVSATILAGMCCPASAREVNLLCLGNSFTRNATKYLPQIVASFPDDKLNLFIVYRGGSTLEYHWKRVEDAETNADAIYARYKGKDYKTFKDLLRAEKWDVIVPIQQYGGTKERFSEAECEPYATNLYKYVKQHAPTAEIMIHQTWAYRDEWCQQAGRRFGTAASPYQAMYDYINGTYTEMAKKFRVKMLPSGAAMKLCRERHPLVVDPKFDYKKPTYPDLPKSEQWSLHTGPTWRTEKDGSHRFVLDCEHAGFRGEYLIGCLWFEMLFGKDARTIPYKPDNLSEEEAKELRNVAHETATTFVQPAQGKYRVFDDLRSGTGRRPGQGATGQLATLASLVRLPTVFRPPL